MDEPDMQPGTHWKYVRTCRTEHEGAPRSFEDFERLPALASEYYELEHERFAWTETLREIMTGVRDDDSHLGVLGGHEQTLVRSIYGYLAHEHETHVKLTLPGACVRNGFYQDSSYVQFPPQYDHFDFRPLPRTSKSPDDYISFACCGLITFPEPNNRNVNMMPFVFGDKKSLPVDLRCYQPCIDMCPVTKDQIGQVYYLTVHETYVDPGKAQRREGLHIEAPGTILEENAPAFVLGHDPHSWGMGGCADVFTGGIYMASSVADTSRLYDAIVDNSIPGITDRHGGCEHLRSIIGPPTDLDKDELIWMTDRTPHEALTQEFAGMRQFFRVVTADVSHWYSKHSTPNPSVPVPAHVIVVEEDKFETKKTVDAQPKCTFAHTYDIV
eukprot:CAMPEP_0197258838 /NCGR_PEP_ID=MMETSP1429-20130617/83210_1 /TAXON_ID=49237 /ORGANISM="Chaetoceros  sp., Strain UNC1202" /LENGTH=383 /DNA_ID=CAMNT_0042723025 /DNA_START=54 /DNA_END=1205 /DNA_ORIENTATION=-